MSRSGDRGADLDAVELQEAPVGLNVELRGAEAGRSLDRDRAAGAALHRLAEALARPRAVGELDGLVDGPLRDRLEQGRGYHGSERVATSARTAVTLKRNPYGAAAPMPLARTSPGPTATLPVSRSVPLQPAAGADATTAAAMTVVRAPLGGNVGRAAAGGDGGAVPSGPGEGVGAAGRVTVTVHFADLASVLRPRAKRNRSVRLPSRAGTVQRAVNARLRSTRATPRRLQRRPTRSSQVHAQRLSCLRVHPPGDATRRGGASRPVTRRRALSFSFGVAADATPGMASIARTMSDPATATALRPCASMAVLPGSVADERVASWLRPMARNSPGDALAAILPALAVQCTGLSATPVFAWL